jgi:tetratricopeptide (TPR) repeat protein
MATFLRRFPLPLQAALGAFLLYLLTLSHGVTAPSLAMTAKIAGWDWQPMASHPLLWLLTLPIRILLPGAWIAAALNLFSALCAAMTLGLLMRSLELLPWFHPLGTLNSWSRRLPFLLALAVCGLEFSFWQDATALTGEMLDLLLLAAAVWCLLEYRVVRDLRWLYRAALVWGLGMADNWVMQFGLVLFVVAAVLLQGIPFFSGRFLLTLLAYVAAGFIALYILLPTVNGLWPGSPWSLGQAWAHSLRETRDVLMGVYYTFISRQRLLGIVMLLFYAVPLVAVFMRAGNEDSSNKPTLDLLLIWFFRGVRVALLLICVWLAFDPVPGPRGVLLSRSNLALPLLSFGYLTALAVGFLAGSLLLIRPGEEMGWERMLNHLTEKWVHRIIMPALTLLLVVIVLGLGARNLPALQLLNRYPLTQFGELAVRSLPNNGPGAGREKAKSTHGAGVGAGVVLSDFPEKLAVFQAALAQAPADRRSSWLAVDTRSLPLPEYRKILDRRLPGAWLVSTTNSHELGPREMVSVLGGLVRNDDKRAAALYLHPSFGYFFESLYQRPLGALYEVKPLPPADKHGTNMSSVGIPTGKSDSVTEKFWDNLTPQIEALGQEGRGTNSIVVQKLMARLHFGPVQPIQLDLLKEWYSQALDTWGVQLQRSGSLPAAQRRFNQALLLNSNNWIAQINLNCNANLQAGTPMSMGGVSALISQIGAPERLGMFVSRYGTIDDPTCCFLLGSVCQQSGLLRQALQNYERAHALAPADLAPQFALAELYLRGGYSELALATIDRLRAAAKTTPESLGLDVQLAVLESGVWLSRSNMNRAQAVLQTTVEQHGEDSLALNRVAQTYFAIGSYTNATRLVSRILAREPDNVPALMLQSGILLQTRQPALAVPVLNHVLTVTNSTEAKLYRVLANIGASNYDAARSDCLDLQNTAPNSYLGEYGLAKIAELQHDTNQAVEYLTICLSNAPPNSAQYHDLRKRLDTLQPAPSSP